MHYTRTLSVGETSQVKESFQEKKVGSCMYNPSTEMKQCKQSVVKNHFVNKDLLKDNDGDEKCVGLPRAELGEDVLVSSEKIDSLGQELNGSQDISHENSKEVHEDPLVASIHEKNVIKGTPKRKHNVETRTSIGGT